jgi:hypothetical protein
MRLTEINQRKLITESWNDPRLTLLETRVIIPFVEDIERFIVEAQLSPDQISQLFTSAEQGMTAGGKNRTMLGKGKDAASFINQKINDLGKAIQNTGPVKNLDAKFADAMKKIDSSDTKVAKAVQGVKQWATDNPGKASVAVAIITAAAAMAGGPMAGAVGGFLSRATKDILQGEKLSTAVGQSVKVGAIGALAGGIADAFSGTDVSVAPASDEAALSPVSTEITSDEVAKAAEVNSPEEIADAMPSLQSAKDAYAERISEVLGNGPTNMSQEMLEKISDTLVVEGDYPNNYRMYLPDGTSMVRGEIFLTPDEAAAYDKWAQGKDISAKLGQEGTDWLKANVEGAEELLSGQEADAAAQQADLKAKYDAMSPEEQKAYDQEQERKYGGFMDYTPPGEPKYNTESKKLSNLQIETLIEWCEGTPAVILTEGPMDALKKAGGAIGGALKKGAAAVGAKAAQVGKNMTTKVTADKLNKAWNKAGKPTDSNKIADILRQAGVSDDVLAPIYKQFGAKLPPVPKPTEKPAVTKDPAAQSSGNAPRAKEPAAAGGQQSGTAPAQGSNAPAGTSSAPAQGGAAPAQGGGQPAAAAGPTDFKSIQQAVAKLDATQAKELVSYIDSMNKTAAAPAANDQTPAQEPAQSGAQPAAGKNAAAGDTYEKAKGDIRNVKGGNKPMPPKTAAAIDAALAKLAKGDKENGVFAAQKIMGAAKLGVDVKDAQAKWLANAKAAQRFLTQSIYYEINSMLREHGLRWSDLGLRIHLVEGTNAYIGISQI